MASSRIRPLALVVALACAALLGCGGGMTFIVQQYAGPPRAPGRIAIVRITSTQRPSVIAVDGQPVQVELEPGNRIHVEMDPGVHEIDVATTDARTGLIQRGALRFVAEAGKVYRADRVGVADSAHPPPEERADTAVYEIDPATDRAIRVAPRVEAASAP